MPIRIPRPFTKKEPNKGLENEQFGIEDSFTGGYSRLLNNDGSFNITRKGSSSVNFFKTFVNVPWWLFFLYLIILYSLLNLIFAFLYLLGGPDSISNILNGGILNDLAQKFYFSVQTFTTVGYGHMTPITTYANIIAVLNAFVGLMYFALATGLFFTKFSSPRSNIIYSKNIIISPLDGQETLMFRVANTLDNQIVNLEAKVAMTWVINENGVPRRKFASLPLSVDSIYLFPLNWTIVHAIDDNSPLKDNLRDHLVNYNTEFLIMIKGYDRTYGKEIHSNRSYGYEDLIDGAIFNTMYETMGEETVLHLDKIDEYRKFDFSQWERKN